MATLSLYDIVGEYRELYAMLTDPDVDEAVLADTLEAVKGELEVKAEGYIKVIRQLSAEVEALEAEADFFKHKAQIRKNNVARMKEALCAALIATGHDDKAGLTAGEFTLKVQNNGGVAPLVITGEVPDSFMRVITEPDKGLIREYIEEHGGDCDFAYLEERGRHLVIK